MKRSEYVKIVNDVMEAESSRIRKQLAEIPAKDDSRALAQLLATIALELPGCAARSAGAIIEKAGLIQFDSEDAE